MTTPQPTPALPPPPGVTPNFEHPITLKRQNNIAIGVAIPLTTTFFLLRAYTRIWIKRTWIFEDWLTFLAYFGTVAFCGTGATVMNHYGGRHEWDITPSQAREASYWFNVASIHYGITIGIAKISVLWLYRRVFSPVRWSLFDIAIVFLVVILALFYTSTTIVKIWECVPRDKIFDPKIPGRCIDIPLLLNVSGLFNTVTDFIILLLPLKAVWNMNMSFQKKIIVVLVFTFGLSAPIFSLVGFLVRLRGSTNPDKTWVQPEIIQWGLAELTAAVLCVCFPELGPLWKKRPRRGPTTSILNGRRRLRDISLRRKAKRGLSTTTSYNLSTFKAEPYVVLEEGSSQCNIEGAPQKSENDQSHEQSAQEVTVTQGITINSTSKA
ncbi:hypothetical protein GGR58DRAFT_478615 [Xylaria digitata]|nr:hypothetical protein GGR58DRAFT_478615 [Xylaria digitata]